MKTKNLIEGKYLEDQEMVDLAREHCVKVYKIDPDGELMKIKHWESSIFAAFNDTLYNMAPMIMDTPEFRAKMIEFLKAKKP